MDYWGLYLTGVNDRGGFVGNTRIAINKAAMLTGASTNAWFLNSALQTAGSPSEPAFRLSPACKEGAQDAEFFRDAKTIRRVAAACHLSDRRTHYSDL